jgi:hypothetical protein
MCGPRKRSGQARRAGLGLAWLTCSLLAACAATPKVASPGQVLDLDRQAVDSYQAGELPRARELLEKAVAAGEKAGLADEKPLAQAYLDLGAVHLAEGDRQAALGSFGVALSLVPEIEPTPDIANPNLKKALAVARIQLKRNRGAAAIAVAARQRDRGGEEPQAQGKDEDKPAGKAAPAPEEKAAAAPAEPPAKEASPTAKVASAADSEEPDLPANVPQPLYCPLPDEAPPSEEVPLRCVSAPTATVASMVLFYRPAGSETFTPVPMVRSRKGWYEGVVPASALVGKTLQYYVEARGPSKEVATSNGSSDSPNLVIIRNGAAPVGRGALAAAQYRREPSNAGEVEDNPLARTERDRERDVERSAASHRRVNALWIGLGLGSGFGWHPRKQLEFRNDDAVAAGFSPAGLMHLSPEIGWQWTRHVAVSLQSRHQFIPESGSGDDRLGSPAHGALAVLLRGYYYFGDGSGQPFLSGAVGGGDGFRLVVPPHPEVGVVRNDTIRGGPLLVGPGAGYLYNFNNHFAWVAEARALVGIPETAVVFELSTGAQVGF